MNPTRLLKTAIMPALDELATLGIPSSIGAARFLLAIALQESGLAHRRQVSSDGTENGPASSFWQFEKNGGCKGVLAHRKAGPLMLRICEGYNVTPESQLLWEAMRYQDIVAAAAARLLIYTLPSGLPMTADEGWAQYISAWRPGKPHPDEWPKNWALASKFTGA